MFPVTKIIGLTGGIGSGKSTIAEVFSKLNVPVYNSDKAAKEIYFNKKIKEEVISALGPNVYKNDSELNKEYIGKKIFYNKELLLLLNSIIHPAVAKDFEVWLKKKNTPYIIRESALLFETGLYKYSYANILVTTDKNTRISRVVKRDHISEEQVLKVIQNQLVDTEKEKFADYIIQNDENKLIIPQVLKIHEILNSLLTSYTVA
ncbi:MAG TPA: dephospho-CoA kinase [Nitrosopumilaceae archaeon]|nr:dephospho-CoA kinase [Nitrosopumilaceae archaeon]